MNPPTSTRRVSLKVNVLATWLAHGVTLVVGFFLVPFILGKIGEENYGAWIFLNSIAGYSGLLYLGFGDTICRYVSKYHAERNWEKLNRVTSCVFVVYLCSGIVAILAALTLAGLAPWLHDWGGQPVNDVRIVLVILGLSAANGLVGSVFGGVLMGIQRFDVERSIQVTVGLLRFGLVLFFLTNRHPLLTLAIIFYALTLLENLCFFLAAKRMIPTLSVRIRHADRQTMKECFSFSAFSALGVVAEYLIYLTDTVVIGFMLGTAAIVPYYVALRICEMVRQPIMQVGWVAMPRAGELQAQSQEHRLSRLIAQGVGVSLILATGMFIGASYFGNILIEVWIEKSDPVSPLILMILLGAQIVALPLGVMRRILLGTGRVRVPSLLIFAAAVTNLVLSLVLIRIWGVVGVAIGTLVPILLFELGMVLPYALKTLKITPRMFLRETIAPHVVPLLCLWTYCEVVNAQQPTTGWVNLFAITLGGGLVLVASWWVCFKCRHPSIDRFAANERPAIR